MPDPHHRSPERDLALRLRSACVRLLESAWEEASIQGLCGTGAMEYALDRLRHADPSELLGTADTCDASRYPDSPEEGG